MKSSIKVGLTVAAVFAVAYGGFWAFGEIQLKNFDPAPIQPGEVTLIALNPKLGFRVRVANSVAQLVQTSSNESGFQSTDKSDSEDARRIPIKELLESLQGNEESLGKLIAVINKISLDELQPGLSYWSADDVQKAINGDPELEKKLVQDLNVELDGTPIDTIRVKSIRNGIIVNVPVPVQVQVGNELKTLTGQVPISYQPRFTKAVSDIIEKRFNPPEEFIVGNYRDIARKFISGEMGKEDIRKSLERFISPQEKERLAAQPEQLLQSAQVLINDSLITSAASELRQDEKGKDLITLKIGLNDEGRKRLWKYSRNTQGFALLVVVNGVAIAAPRISTELSQSEISITGLREKRLVDDAVTAIKNLKTSK
ncbi:MAG: hypothetical protein KF824_06385 [Fimbriimonadaceae bacterium]|nr:MAG: hypothetical protein KF824_06385 [Fimbriimonadaceae bacterium]